MKIQHLLFLFAICLFCSCDNTEKQKESYKVNLTSDTYWKVFPENDQANKRVDVLSSINIDIPSQNVIIYQGQDSLIYIIDSYEFSSDSLLTINSHIDEDLSAIITVDCNDFSKRLIVQQKSEKYNGKNYDIQYRISHRENNIIPMTGLAKNEHFPFLDIPMDCSASEMSERLVNIGFNYLYHSEKWTHLTGYIYGLLCDICICETSKSHMVYEIRINLHKPYQQSDVMALLNNLIINYGNFQSPYSWFFLTYKEPRGVINIYELNGDLDIRFVDNINEELGYKELK